MARRRRNTDFVLTVIVKENPDVALNMMRNTNSIVSAFAIYDTGSPPESIKAMNDFMIEHDKPGEVISRPWVDHFGFSRTEAFRHAENVVFRVDKGLLGPAGKEIEPDPSHPKHHLTSRTKSAIPDRPLTHEEYLKYRPDQLNEKYNFLRDALVHHEDWILDRNWYYLITDADNRIIYNNEPKDSTKPVVIPYKLTADSYSITTSQNNPSEYSYSSPFAFKVDPKRRWRYRLFKHEYTEAMFEKSTRETINGIWMFSGREGLRSQHPKKYLLDAIGFLVKTEKKPKKGRYWFYLGQSYKDAGPAHYRDAYFAYRKCAETWGWVEEIYLSYIECAQLALSVFPGNEGAYLFQENIVKAREMMWDQWDAPFKFMTYWKDRHQFRLGWDVAKSIVDIKPGNRSLYMNLNLINYEFYMLAALCAYKSDAYAESLRIYQMALMYDKLPANKRTEIEKMIKEVQEKASKK